jgi:hypothetical protein
MQVNNTGLTISFNRRLNQSNRTAVYLISQIRNPVSILSATGWLCELV